MEAPSDADRLQAFAPVQEMMTYVQFANDECDYGMGLELGYPDLIADPVNLSNI